VSAGSLIDFILNIAALLLWVNWRSIQFDPLTKSSPATLAGTLKRAEPLRFKGWHFPLALASLLFLRAWIYWQIGPLVDWTPSLKLGAIAISFRSDFFLRALLFSLFSFGLTLAIFYLWLLLLSIVNRKVTDAEPFQKLVRLHLGWLDRWFWPLKLVLPLLIVAALWMSINPLLARSNIIPPCASSLHRLEQGGTIGLGVYISWKYLIAVILALYLLSSYVYLGTHPFWTFLTVTGRNLLLPLRWIPLRLGKLDLAPLIGIAVTLALAEFAQRKLTTLYTHLPL
jgi:uncharacterized protein YggT (Ycf19 family)